MLSVIITISYLSQQSPTVLLLTFITPLPTEGTLSIQPETLKLQFNAVTLGPARNNQEGVINRQT